MTGGTRRVSVGDDLAARFSLNPCVEYWEHNQCEQRGTDQTAYDNHRQRTLHLGPDAGCEGESGSDASNATVAVIKIGLRRSMHPSIIASSSDFPCSRSKLILEINAIPSSTATPNRLINPTDAEQP